MTLPPQLRNLPPAWRLVLGFTLAPAASLVMMIALAVAFGVVGMATPIMLFVAFACAYIPTLVLGVPAYILARGTVTPTPIASAIMGALVAASGWLLHGLQSVDWRLLLVGLEVAPFGAIGGLVFWAIVLRVSRTERLIRNSGR